MITCLSWCFGCHAEESKKPRSSRAVKEHADKDPTRTDEKAKLITEAPLTWKVSDQEFEEYLAMFKKVDANKDGVIAGQEGRAVLLEFGLPREELKRIWEMSDVNQDGRLTQNQFVCAVHLASRRQQGLELPTELPPELARGVANEIPCWEVSDADYLRYKDMFKKLDADRNGIVAGHAARPLLESFGLSIEELKQIWRLSDVDQDGRLTQNQFVCAVHLVSRRQQGLELPTELPPGLARGVANEIPCWKVSDADYLRYKEMFKKLDADRNGIVAGHAARPLLESFGLSIEELKQIWRLSDVDQDGRLTQNQFVCAVHMAIRRQQGLDLPSELPAELARGVANEMPVDEGVPSEPPQDAARGAANEVPASVDLPPEPPPAVARSVASEMPSSESLPSEPPPAMSRPDVPSGIANDISVSEKLPSEPPEKLATAVVNGTSSKEAPSWKVSNEDYQRYTDIFQELDTDKDGILAGQEARLVLEEDSGLPREELKQIWTLADVNKDGRLTLNQFVCAYHMATRRQQGFELPRELPPELARGVAKEIPVNAISSQKDSLVRLRPPVSWKVTDQDYKNYCQLFSSTDRDRDGFLSGQEATFVLSQKYGLPMEDLTQFLQLSNVNAGGKLNLNQFVCAMHLASRRKQGVPIPPSLPPELARIALPQSRPSLGVTAQSYAATFPKPVQQMVPILTRVQPKTSTVRTQPATIISTVRAQPTASITGSLPAVRTAGLSPVASQTTIRQM